MLSWLKEINFFFVFLSFFGWATVEGTSLKSTLDFHVIGFNERTGYVNMFALLEAVLFLLNPELAALSLRNLASCPYLSILPAHFHS